jgi:hypothetical protein
MAGAASAQYLGVMAASLSSNDNHRRCCRW